jgi:hypothetical protein
MDPAPITVVYIAGAGRSGSTLLGNALGSIGSAFSTGELHMIWAALMNGSGCACGERVERCPVWSGVLERLARSRAEPIDPPALRTLQREESRVVQTGRVLRQLDRGDPRPGLTRYLDLLADLYRAIAETVGTRVIVNSSKNSADAALLERVRGVDGRVIHLVRDPRAVAHSHARVRPTNDPYRVTTMHREGAIESAARWVAVNHFARRVGTRADARYTVVRYEDFVAAPRATLERLASFGGLDADVPLTSDGKLVLRSGHAVWGNRNRFASGGIALRADDAWRTEASRRTVWVSTAVAAPWLRRYGYPLRARGSTVPPAS